MEGVIGLGLLLLAAAISSLTVAWITRDPNTKAGSLRRNLDAVKNETDERERQIQELTGTPLEKQPSPSACERCTPGELDVSESDPISRAESGQFVAVKRRLDLC